MTEDEFNSKVFDLLWILTERYPAGDGPSCAETTDLITDMAREIKRD